MHSVSIPSATVAPPIIFQANHVRRRIEASDPVARLVAELCFGPTRRSDLAALASVTAARLALSDDRAKGCAK